MNERPHLILLHADDSILVCVTPIVAGDLLEIDGVAVTARQAIDVGHKLARRSLQPGDKVIKYGAPIGSITEPTPAGGWVHVHNMKSDYLASHSREAVSQEKK
jgi:D-threo-aldose 1-dehydrogenase